MATALATIVFTPIALKPAILRRKDPEAQITLHTIEASGLAEILSSLRLPEGFMFADRDVALAVIQEGSETWWRMSNTAPGRTSEQGGFATLADGVRLIDHARTLRDLPAIPEQLAAAGLEQLEACPTIWQSTVKKDQFTLVWEDGCISLMVSHTGRPGVRPLLRLYSHYRTSCGTIVPCTWPSYLLDQRVHVALACRIVIDARVASTNEKGLELSN